jgi:enoyl-CoA hydratase/carnithine racemase
MTGEDMERYGAQSQSGACMFFSDTHQSGLVSKVVANEALIDEAFAIANKIAANSLPSSCACVFVRCAR